MQLAEEACKINHFLLQSRGLPTEGFREQGNVAISLLVTRKQKENKLIKLGTRGQKLCL